MDDDIFDINRTIRYHLGRPSTAFWVGGKFCGGKNLDGVRPGFDWNDLMNRPHQVIQEEPVTTLRGPWMIIDYTLILLVVRIIYTATRNDQRLQLAWRGRG